MPACVYMCATYIMSHMNWYTHVYVGTHAHDLLYVHIYAHTYTHLCIPFGLHVSARHAKIRECLCFHVCVPNKPLANLIFALLKPKAGVCVSVCVCIYIYIYIYIILVYMYELS